MVVRPDSMEWEWEWEKWVTVSQFRSEIVVAYSSFWNFGRLGRFGSFGRCCRPWSARPFWNCILPTSTNQRPMRGERFLCSWLLDVVVFCRLLGRSPVPSEANRVNELVCICMQWYASGQSIPSERLSLISCNNLLTATQVTL